MISRHASFSISTEISVTSSIMIYFLLWLYYAELDKQIEVLYFIAIINIIIQEEQQTQKLKPKIPTVLAL